METDAAGAYLTENAENDDRAMTAARTLTGFRFIPGYLDRPAQQALLAELKAVLASAPPYTPRMPKTGKPMSVRMTNCGPLGWVTDERGYRYQPTHPETGEPWPAMPPLVLAAWTTLAGYPHPPESCLVNCYGPAASWACIRTATRPTSRRRWSRSRSAIRPVSDRRNEAQRPDPTLRLSSGDAVVLGGEARLAFHGVDRIVPGTSTLLPEGGRINLTLRRVTVPGGGS